MTDPQPQTFHVPTSGERSGHCHDCPFFDVLQGTTTDGQPVPPAWGGVCRADPPRETFARPDWDPGQGVSVLRQAAWPMVSTQDFCGRHPLRVAAYQEAVKTLTLVVQEATAKDKAARRQAGRDAMRGMKRP